MSSPTGSSQWLANPGGGDFYNDVATKSLRLDAPAKKQLNRTMTTGNRRLFTYSFWFKPTTLGTKFFVSKGENVSNADISQISIDGSDRLYIREYLDDSVTLHLVTTRVLRDLNAWYNVVIAFDTAQSTAANRIKLYINGVQETSFGTETYPGQNYDALFTFNQSSSSQIFIGAYSADTNDASEHWDGYFSDITHIDGAALAPASFGETKNGVWIPIDTSGLTFGDEGYLLKFDQVGVGTASTSTIGADTSGNNNHFTSANIIASDCALPDSPENNFCILNLLQLSNNDANFFLKDGNLRQKVSNNSGYRNCSGTFSPMGFKGYFEYTILGTLNMQVGIVEDTTHPTNQDYADSSHQTIIMNDAGVIRDSASIIRSAADHALGTLAVGNIYGVAFDFTGTNRNIWYHNDNTYGTASGGVGNPATGANPIATASNFDSTRDFRFIFASNTGGAVTSLILNFGQDSTFQGNETAATNTDANGFGEFHYEPPSGFLALCSANLEEPTIGPNSSTNSTDNFNTILWTGNGGDDRSIGGVGFKPDFVWLKQRNGTNYHTIFDSTRGATKAVYPNDPEAEATNADTLQAFESDGFELGTSGGVNGNNNTFVAWNWKANGGTTSTLTGGTIDSVVQANTDAGFSIVTYTGDDQARATVAHGLSKAPEMIIVKNRDEAISNPAWPVYHASNTSAPATDYLDLSDDGGTDDAETLWSDEVPTDTLVILGTADSVNSGSAHVMYCFHSVEGYSKLGSYVTNAGNSGPFVHTGFRPAFVMVKVTGGGSNASYWSWTIYDNKRVLFNRNHSPLFANHNIFENYRGDGSTTSGGNTLYFDFLSNGFRVMNGGTEANGTAGSPVVYMAFAEMPFKYANAK